jgi:hypothetical protein
MTQNERIERLERLLRDMAVLVGRNSPGFCGTTTARIVSALDSPEAAQIEGGAGEKVCEAPDVDSSPCQASASPSHSAVLSEERIAMLRRVADEAWGGRLNPAGHVLHMVLDDREELRRQLAEAWQAYAEAEQTNIDLTRERDEALADGNGVQRALSMQLSAAEAKLDEARAACRCGAFLADKGSVPCDCFVGNDFTELHAPSCPEFFKPTSPSPEVCAGCGCSADERMSGCGMCRPPDDGLLHGTIHADSGPSRPAESHRAKPPPEHPDNAIVDKLMARRSAGAVKVALGEEALRRMLDEAYRLLGESQAQAAGCGKPSVHESGCCSDCARARLDSLAVFDHPVDCACPLCQPQCAVCNLPEAEHPTLQVSCDSFVFPPVAKPPPSEPTLAAVFSGAAQEQQAKRLATLNVLARTCREHKAAGIRLPRGVLNALAALDATEPRNE